MIRTIVRQTGPQGLGLYETWLRDHPGGNLAEFYQDMAAGLLLVVEQDETTVTLAIGSAITVTETEEPMPAYQLQISTP